MGEPFITWNDSYSVNIAEVDSQHKRLLGLLNNLFDAMSVGQGRSVVGQVLEELVEYTVYHFGTEERLFQKYQYPEYEKHKKQHDDLTAKAKQLKETFEQGQGTLMVSAKVMFFLRDWLKTHIQGEDKKFGPYLNSKGVH